MGFTDFKIQNMVSTADLGFPIRLEALVYAHAKFASYEPELFPGLIYRLVSPKTVLLIFVSGRMVITGGKSLSDLRTAFDKMYPVLCDFRKESTPFDRRPPKPRAIKDRPTVEDAESILPQDDATAAIPTPP